MLKVLARQAAGRRERLGVAKLGRKRGAGKADPPGSTAARRKAFLQVSMEQNMGCAVGACLAASSWAPAGRRSASAARARCSPPTSWTGRADLAVKRRRRRHAAAISGRVPVRPRGPRATPAPRPGGPSRADVDRAAGPRAAPAGRPWTSVDLGRGLILPNPILVASGTFGYGIEYGDVVDVDRLGGICCKGTTLKARIGNPTPRVTETPGGMLNSIGLQNPGVDAVIAKYAQTWTDVAGAGHRQRRR